MPPKRDQESGFPLGSKYDLGSLGGRFMFPSTTALGTEGISFAKKQGTRSVPFISSRKFPNSHAVLRKQIKIIHGFVNSCCFEEMFSDQHKNLRLAKTEEN